MANYLLKLNETFYLYLILPKCKKTIKTMISASSLIQGRNSFSVPNHCLVQQNKITDHPIKFCSAAFIVLNHD